MCFQKLSSSFMLRPAASSLSRSLLLKLSLSPPAAPAPSPSLCFSVVVYVARPLSSHRLICWGRTEGGRGFMSLSTQTFLLYYPSPSLKPLPWRLCWRFFFFSNQTSLCLFWFSGMLSDFLLVFSQFLPRIFFFFFNWALIWEQQAEVIGQKLF